MSALKFKELASLTETQSISTCPDMQRALCTFLNMSTVPECPLPTDSDVNRKVLPLRVPLGFIFSSASAVVAEKLNLSE